MTSRFRISYFGALPRGWGKVIKCKTIRFYKGSHVIYQMKGIDEVGFGFHILGAFRGGGTRSSSAEFFFLKGSHVVYKTKDYRVYHSCTGGVDV